MQEAHMMQKVVIHSAGGYDKLLIEDHPMPAVEAGQVLVSIKATGTSHSFIQSINPIY